MHGCLTDAGLLEVMVEVTHVQRVDKCQRRVPETSAYVLVEPALSACNRLCVEIHRPVVLGQPVEPFTKRQLTPFVGLLHASAVPQLEQERFGISFVAEEAREPLLAVSLLVGELDAPATCMLAALDLPTGAVTIVGASAHRKECNGLN